MEEKIIVITGMKDKCSVLGTGKIKCVDLK